jgi:hypothetical protein
LQHQLLLPFVVVLHVHTRSVNARGVRRTGVVQMTDALTRPCKESVARSPDETLNGIFLVISFKVLIVSGMGFLLYSILLCSESILLSLKYLDLLVHILKPFQH